MEENKCCENGKCEKCSDKKEGCYCHHKCHGKCCLLKALIAILVILAVFCIGTMVGSHQGVFRERNFNQRYGNDYGLRGEFNNFGADTTATIKILPPETKTTTPVPPVTNQ